MMIQDLWKWLKVLIIQNKWALRKCSHIRTYEHSITECTLSQDFNYIQKDDRIRQYIRM